MYEALSAEHEALTAEQLVRCFVCDHDPDWLPESKAEAARIHKYIVMTMRRGYTGGKQCSRNKCDCVQVEGLLQQWLRLSFVLVMMSSGIKKAMDWLADCHFEHLVIDKQTGWISKHYRLPNMKVKEFCNEEVFLRRDENGSPVGFKYLDVCDELFTFIFCLDYLYHIENMKFSGGQLMEEN